MQTARLNSELGFRRCDAEMTFEEIGLILGFSRTRAQQIFKRAIEKLVRDDKLFELFNIYFEEDNSQFKPILKV